MRIFKPKGKKKFSRLNWQKHHPLVVPVVTFFVLFFASCVGLIATGGETIGANDSKVVRLHVDGKTRTIPTRAQTVGDLLERLGVELHDEDVVEPTRDSAILSDDFRINVYRARPITVIDQNGQKTFAKVAEGNANEMAQKAGVVVYPEDKVAIADASEALKDGVIGAKVVIDRATPAHINLYGNHVPTRTHAKTVGELLDEKGIKTLEGDTVQPSRDAPVVDNTQIFVLRLGKQVATVEEAIQAPVENISDPNVLAGMTVIKEQGAPGKKIVTYEIELHNGREASRKPIQEIVALTPVKRVVAKGTKVVISNPSANVALGQKLAADKGWMGEQWYCLYQLWQKESKWNHLASNRTSGAYGIPQALPGSKMGTVGADWQTNPETQIIWGLGYITRVYKTPCGAWQKSQASGWY